MQDIVLGANPLRYKFTPVGGGDPIYYDVEFDGTIATPGTNIDKVCLFPDSLASKYGLNTGQTDYTQADFCSPANAFAKVWNYMYPVGSIYMTVDGAFAPGTTWGGTWVRWGEGKVPVGYSTTDSTFGTVEATGGSKQLKAHTHSLSNHTHSTPNHTHTTESTTSTMSSSGGGTSGSTTPGATGNASQAHTHTFSDTATTGTSGSAHVHDTRYLTYTVPSGSTYAIKGLDASSSLHDDFVYGTSGSHTHSVTVSGTTATNNVTHNHTSAAHTHTTPDHTHTMNGHTHSILSSGGGTSGDGGAGSTGSTGASSEPDVTANMPPYIVCYMWKRTA